MTTLKIEKGVGEGLKFDASKQHLVVRIKNRELVLRSCDFDWINAPGTDLELGGIRFYAEYDEETDEWTVTQPQG